MSSHATTPRLLSFSSSQIEATFHPRTRSLRVDPWSIIVNISPRPITYRTGGVGAMNVLGPFESAYVRRVRVTESDALVVLRIIDEINIASLIFEKGWNLYADLNPRFPANRTLWRSSQDEIGKVELDPHLLIHRATDAVAFRHYRVSLNLWYASAGTDCGIHREHGFLELHTQIYGTGHMQKFEKSNPGSLYEELILPVGTTHHTFAVEDDDHSNFAYPWHRYFAATGCVWMAIELAESL